MAPGAIIMAAWYHRPSESRPSAIWTDLLPVRGFRRGRYLIGYPRLFSPTGHGRRTSDRTRTTLSFGRPASRLVTPFELMLQFWVPRRVSSPASPAHRIPTGLAGWALVCSLAATALLAHGGHEGVAPTFREVQIGTQRWRVGLGAVPADPFVGDELRIEIKAEIVPSEDGAPARLANLDELKLSADTTALELKPTINDGVFAAARVVESAGALRLSVELREAGGSPGTAEFPIHVRPAAAGWLRFVVLIVILLVLASPGLFLSRDLRRWWDRGSRLKRALLVGTAVAVVAAMLPVSGAIAAALAVAVAPERPTEAVDWVIEAPAGGPHLAEAASEPPSEVASGSGELDPAQIVARVMARPDGVADVIVPMTGRVVPVEGAHVTVGSRVTKGQTLMRLQPSYIMHDALHLINQRWPILQNVMATRRRKLEAQVTVDRLKAALASDAGTASSVVAAESAATAAQQDSVQWSRTLALHDAQIKDDQPKNVELIAAISGEIAAANFTHGQLVYEGRPIFTIVDLTTVWVEVRVPEKVASKFQREEVAFGVPSVPDLTLTGRLVRVAPAVDPLSRTLSHFYTVANPRRLLRIGMLLSLAEGPSPAAPETKTVLVLGRVAAKPELQAVIVAPIWGRMEFASGPVSVGKTVKKGDPLVRIALELSATERNLMDARKLEIVTAAALAETRRQQAERDYRRSVTVLKVDPSNPIRRAEVVGTELLFKLAQEEKSLYDRQAEVFDLVLKRRDPRITVVEAPLSGVITALNMKPGDLSQIGQFVTLGTVTDLSRVWIEADVFERDVTHLIDGVHASFTTDDGVTRELGRPVAILPWVDEQTRIVKAVFEVPNPDGRLRLSMTVHVSLDPAAREKGK